MLRDIKDSFLRKQHRTEPNQNWIELNWTCKEDYVHMKIEQKQQQQQQRTSTFFILLVQLMVNFASIRGK